MTWTVRGLIPGGSKRSPSYSPPPPPYFLLLLNIQAGSRAKSASYSMGTRGYFPGVYRPSPEADRGTRWRSWLRHSTTSRKIAVSIFH
jgi:hypothetical protein